MGRRDEGMITSGATERVVLRRPFVLYELTIVKPVVERLKKPSGVKWSKAITSPLPKNWGRRETVDKKEL